MHFLNSNGVSPLTLEKKLEVTLAFAFLGEYTRLQ